MPLSDPTYPQPIIGLLLYALFKILIMNIIKRKRNYNFLIINIIIQQRVQNIDALHELQKNPRIYIYI